MWMAHLTLSATDGGRHWAGRRSPRDIPAFHSSQDSLIAQIYSPLRNACEPRVREAVRTPVNLLDSPARGLPVRLFLCCLIYGVGYTPGVHSKSCGVVLVIGGSGALITMYGIGKPAKFEPL